MSKDRSTFPRCSTTIGITSSAMARLLRLCATQRLHYNRNPTVAYTPDMETVEREVVLPAPPDDVWDLVTELGAWFGTEVEGDVEVGEVVRIGGRRALIERVNEP